MPTATTTVHKNKIRPIQVVATDALGEPLSPSVTLASASLNQGVVGLTSDPQNNRRYLIAGVSEGTGTVEIGSGPNKLSITVTVEAPLVDPAQVNRVDVLLIETEI